MLYSQICSCNIFGAEGRGTQTPENKTKTAKIHLFNNTALEKRCEISSKLTIKTPKRRH